MASNRFTTMGCYAEFHEKVVAGVVPEAIAEWLREEQDEGNDIGKGSLVRAIYRYRDALPPGTIVTPETSVIVKKIERLTRGRNELESLDELFLLQKARLEGAIALEDKIGFFNQKLVKDIELMKNILVETVKLKIELGISPRAPYAFEVSDTTARERTPVEAVAALDPESRSRFGAVAKLLQAALTAGPTQPLDGAETPDVEYEVLEETPEAAATHSTAASETP